MTNIRQYGRGIALYALLLVSIALSVWSFIRSDQYRERSVEILHQTFEVQWRASQIREKLAIVIGDLELAVVTDKPSDRLDAEVNFLRFNIRTLLELDYTPDILYPRDIALLNRMTAMINGSLAPTIRVGEYDNALAIAMRVRQDILSISGTAVAHSHSLSDEAIIDANAEQNRYQFALALAVVILIVIFIYHRSLIARREDNHLRSFSSLFGHTTRRRIAPLRLTLMQMADEPKLNRTRLEEAQRTVQDLIGINEELVRIAHAGSVDISKSDLRPERLISVLDGVVGTHDQASVRFEAEEDAKVALVPAAEFHVLVDELIVNAKRAVASCADPLITVTAQVKRGWLLRRRLIVNVSDNGAGMDPDVLANATTLFFSTRGGNHVGLGLSSCAAIMKAMGGRLHLESAPGAGTTVQIVYPLR